MNPYIRASDRTAAPEVYQRTTNRHYETHIVELPADAGAERERRILELQARYAELCTRRKPHFTARPGKGVICLETGRHYPSQRAAVLSLKPEAKRYKSLEVLMSRALRDGTAFEGYHWKRESSDK